MPLKVHFFDFSGIPGNRGTLTFRGFPGVGRARPTPRFGRVGWVGTGPSDPSKPTVWTVVQTVGLDDGRGGNQGFPTRPDPGLEVSGTRFRRPPNLLIFRPGKVNFSGSENGHFFDLEKCPNFDTFPTRKVSTFEVPEPQVWTIQKKWPYFQPRKVTIKVATFLVTFLDVKNELKVARLTTPDGSVLIYILLIKLATFRPPPTRPTGSVWGGFPGLETSSLPLFSTSKSAQTLMTFSTRKSALFRPRNCSSLDVKLGSVRGSEKSTLGSSESTVRGTVETGGPGAKGTRARLGGGNRATRDPGNHGFPGPGKSGNRGFPTSRVPGNRGFPGPG